MAWQSVIPPVALTPVILMPTLLGRAGLIYLIGPLALTSGFLCCGVQLSLLKSNLVARRLLFASIIYLPLLLVLMVLDK
jgi:protoheme IX farnesyltransferase